MVLLAWPEKCQKSTRVRSDHRFGSILGTKFSSIAANRQFVDPQLITLGSDPVDRGAAHMGRPLVVSCRHRKVEKFGVCFHSGTMFKRNLSTTYGS